MTVDPKVLNIYEPWHGILGSQENMGVTVRELGATVKELGSRE